MVRIRPGKLIVGSSEPAVGRMPHHAFAPVERARKENRNLSVVLYDIEGSEATGYEVWLLSD